MGNEARKSEPIRVEVSTAELPESIVSRFSDRPPADARFAVTVEPVESEAERLAASQRDLQSGLDDLAAGWASDGADVFARLKARFNPG